MMKRTGFPEALPSKIALCFFSFLLCLLSQTAVFAADGLPTARYVLTVPHGKINASWQKSGVREIDDYAEQKVRKEAGAFRERIKDLEEGLKSMNMEIPSCELNITAAISSGGKTIGVLWAVYEYLGGNHGTLSLESNIYSVSPLKDGKRTVKKVRLNDIFRNPRSACQIFSEYARKELLAQHFDPAMVEPGTTPDMENFKIFLIHDQGLTLFFEPYQVASWADGTVRVIVPLEKLKPAGPVLSYWK